MSIDSQLLYTFLSACSGNWRNTIHITSQRQDCAGYLLAFDRDGLPVFMAVDQLQQISGEQLDPAECCGQIALDTFKTLFAQYLLWHTASDNEESISLLSQKTPEHP